MNLHSMEVNEHVRVTILSDQTGDVYATNLDISKFTLENLKIAKLVIEGMIESKES